MGRGWIEMWNRLRLRLRPRGPLPWGFLGMLLLVGAAENFFAHHKNDRFLNLYSWSWRQAAHLADTRGTSNSVVSFGDSIILGGFVPGIVEAETGRRGLNLAICGGSAPSSFFLFRRLLESGACPEAVVLESFPSFLGGTPAIEPSQWASVASLRDGVELALAGRDAGFLGSFVAAKLLTSYRARFEVRKNLGEALGGTYNEGAHHVPRSYARNMIVNRGAMLWAAKPPGPVERDIEGWAKRWCPEGWNCHPVNSTFLRRFFELAQSRQIPVLWVLTPYRPELQAQCERTGFDARHTQFVRALHVEFPGVTVVDARRSGYDSNVFVDPHHIGREGAGVLSVELSALLRRAVSGATLPAWINLPPFRDRALPFALEDVEQSEAFFVARRARRTMIR